jgi:hypothetical protein
MLRLNRGIRRGAAAAVILAALLPASASASWGKKSDNGEHCSQANPHHCYVLAKWLMEGSEQVEGTLAYQYTTAMNIPGWASGDFVDNEEWAAFEPYYHWVEAGQTAGEYMDCCSLHPFYAYNNSAGYWQYVAPWTVAGWTNNLYQLVAAGSGVWCVDWTYTQVSCSSGFPTYSNNLEVGDEIAANIKPENAGHEQTNATFLNGKQYNWLKERAYADGGMCVSRYTGPPYPALGNINFGTC